MMKRLVPLLFILLILALLGTPRSLKAIDNTWEVYGSMACGWTRKQLDHLKSLSIPYKFIDCSGGKCPGIDAFPTLKQPQSGKTIVGYNEDL